MNSTDYMKNVKRTESPHFTKVNERLLHGIIGICTESGELMDVIKKNIFYKQSIDIPNLKEEVGDILWYLGLICMHLECTFEDIMDMNIKKLKARYPNKFTVDKAKNRDYKVEQDAAENGDN